MQCSKCGHPNREAARFCEKCGDRQDRQCPQCRQTVSAEAIFCDSCGRNLSQPTEPSVDPDSPTSAASPLPEGERRQATVLFSDLSGYTAMNEKLDPEEVQSITSRIKAEAVRIVEGHGGIVNQFIGDEVVGLFGIPTAHDDDPVRAVRAARDLHNLVRAMSPDVEDRIGAPLRLHTGINSGLIVTDFQDQRDGTYGITGDTVNVAARLVGHAEADAILVSPVTQRLIANYFQTEVLGPVTLKGKADPLTLHRVAAERPVPAKAISDFIGRRAELRQFTGSIDACLDSGRGLVVYIRGGAGIGKTQLVEEFQALAATRGFACHTGLVLDFGVGKGRDAIRAVVTSLLDVPAGGSEEVRHAAAERAISEGLVERKWEPVINDLLDLPQPLELRAIYDAMDNDTRNQSKQETISRLIRRASMSQPLMVTVEDLHWADVRTLAHLSSIAATVADVPALLVLTSRIEGDPLDQAWRGATAGTSLITIDLAPLRKEESVELANAFGELSDSFMINCIERAEGNPLFLVQLLSSGEEIAEDRLPGSVQSTVQARMDILEPADKQALQAASVFGQQFQLESLRHLIENPRYTCDGLIAQHLVRPEGESYLFAHALVQEGVYNSVLKARRRELHCRAAGWFSERDLVLRAEHLARAQDPEAASAYLEAAQNQAAEFRYERALLLAEHGLALAGEPDLKFLLTCYQGQLLQDLGEIPRSIEAYRQALDMAGDDLQRCRAWIGLAGGLRVIDQSREALVTLEKAEKPAKSHGLTLELAQIHHLRGNVLFPLGDCHGCLREHESALKYAREAGSPEGEARSLGGLGDAYYLGGRMNTAYDHFRRSVDLCRQHGFGSIEVAYLPMVGWSGIYSNDFHRALGDGLAAAETAEKVGHHRAESLACGLVAFLNIEMGDFVKAKDQLNRAIALAQSLKARRFEAHFLCYLGKIAELEGKRSSALNIVGEALEICHETGMNYIGPSILGSLGLITDDPVTRQSALEEGESLLRDGCVSHNYLWFYRDAMEASLNNKEWNSAERYSTLLGEYTRTEPLPWANFFITRGRALAAFGSGRRDEATMLDLRNLRNQAQQVGFELARKAIEKALDSQTPLE